MKRSFASYTSDLTAKQQTTLPRGRPGDVYDAKFDLVPPLSDVQFEKGAARQDQHNAERARGSVDEDASVDDEQQVLRVRANTKRLPRQSSQADEEIGADADDDEIEDGESPPRAQPQAQPYPSQSPVKHDQLLPENPDSPHDAAEDDHTQPPPGDDDDDDDDFIDWDLVPISVVGCTGGPGVDWTEEHERQMAEAALMPLPDLEDDEGEETGAKGWDFGRVGMGI